MKRFKTILIILFAICLFVPVHPVFASPVQDQLKASIDKLLDILRDPQYQGDASADKRRQALRTIIYERFSFEKMSQLSLGANWKKINDQQKDEFIKLFSQLLEDTYVTKIEGYTNEKILFTKELVNKKKAQINTKIVTDSVEIPLDYRMYQAKDGSWMVYDMIIEGVSLVGNYRSQFSEILQNDSFEKLMEELKKKISS
ncbi:MAG: ABC transporter substrate-binding protein [Pseudomonadota bacterium]